jgi:3-keto-5-aminohexanoate cleavage enzyme
VAQTGSRIIGIFRAEGIMGERIVVAVAPVAHVGGHLPPEVKNPLTPEEVAAETLACWRAGASLAHHHVRNLQGEIVSDLRWYRETVDRIRADSDIILNVSTGGVSELSLEERCVGLNDPRVEMGSLNMGSTNFGEGVYVNTLPDIRYWARRMKETGVAPELEIFGPSMLETAWRLRDEGTLEEPLHYNFPLGFEGSLSAAPRNLANLVAMLPDGSIWGVVHEGMEDLSLQAAALGLGATVLRVGYEDGGYLRRGVPAPSNARLVEQLVTLIRAAGLEVANTTDAREILQLSPRNL